MVGNRLIETREINGHEIDIVGCYDSHTPKNQFDFFDLYMGDICINEGEPCYTFPTDEDIRAFLDLQFPER